MSRWVDYGLADRLYMTSHVKKNIDQESVEKDWWVTTVLKAFFELSTAKYSFFKGGTSLSKGWNIINRFRHRHCSTSRFFPKSEGFGMCAMHKQQPD